MKEFVDDEEKVTIKVDGRLFGCVEVVKRWLSRMHFGIVGFGEET